MTSWPADLLFAGGGFPWAEDFPLSAEKPPLATPAPPMPPAPGLLSRFTVSPAPASRFSITHVSDPDTCAQRGEAGGARREGPQQGPRGRAGTFTPVPCSLWGD